MRRNDELTEGKTKIDGKMLSKRIGIRIVVQS